MKRLAGAVALFFAGAVLADSPPVHACAVCFGDGKSNLIRSIWPGVYVLLGLVGLVLAPIAYLGWTWMRRDARQPRP